MFWFCYVLLGFEVLRYGVLFFRFCVNVNRLRFVGFVDGYGNSVRCWGFSNSGWDCCVEDVFLIFGGVVFFFCGFVDLIWDDFGDGDFSSVGDEGLVEKSY